MHQANSLGVTPLESPVSNDTEINKRNQDVRSDMIKGQASPPDFTHDSFRSCTHAAKTFISTPKFKDGAEKLTLVFALQQNI